jgi:hypothetical protein
VSTIPLPDDPSFEQLRKQAKELQRAVRDGDPDALAEVAARSPQSSLTEDVRGTFPLRTAQLVLARRHGFPSWARLKHHLEVVEQYSRAPDRVESLSDPADEFLRLSCLTYGEDDPTRWAAARELLHAHPDIPSRSIHAAAAVAEPELVRRFLDRDRTLARIEGGPHRWTPLFYLAYTRHDPDVTEAAAVATTKELLLHGADPNEGYLWHGMPTPFTVLTGIFGEGEGGPVLQPRHPHSLALARVLLDAGADPNDGQTLYNRMFEPGNDHLELLFEYGLGQGDGGLWRTRLGEAVESPGQMLGRQLSWAVMHEMTERVRLLVSHGVDVDGVLPDGRTPTELAAVCGNVEMVHELRRLGASAPDLDPVDAIVAAALAGDAEQVRSIAAAHASALDEARRTRPALVVWAAARRRNEAIRLLATLGFDVNARGRRDVPRDDPWETALHVAASRGDVEMARLLLSLGADPSIRDGRFDAPPLSWAGYSEQPAMIALLEPLTT